LERVGAELVAAVESELQQELKAYKEALADLSRGIERG
jgi:hypothetical protein